MEIGKQMPIIGTALAGGMAQAYLIKKYPDWSWLLSLGMVGGGAFLATKPGWGESIGLGIACAGASGLGTSLLPVGEETTARQTAAEIVRRRELAAARQKLLTEGQGSQGALDRARKTASVLEF